MTFRPIDTSGFEFVTVSALRAVQLMRGCTPRVPASHKFAMTAQREVAAGKVSALPRVATERPARPGA